MEGTDVQGELRKEGKELACTQYTHKQCEPPLDLLSSVYKVDLINSN